MCPILYLIYPKFFKNLKDSQNLNKIFSKMTNLFEIQQVFKLFFLFLQHVYIYFHFLKITTKFSQKQGKLYLNLQCFINHKNFLKIFSTVFKVSLKFFLKFPLIFSKTTLGLGRLPHKSRARARSMTQGHLNIIYIFI